jgi:F0F1-type ATP synthase membrane subunit b/b'
MRKRLFFLVLALAVALPASTAAGHSAHAIDWFSVLSKVLNSTLLFGGLILALRKPLIRMLAQKGEGIRRDFAEREHALAASEARLQEIGRRLEQVAAEVGEIKGSAQAAGQEELARLEAAGRQEAERIIALGEEEIRQRVDAAVRAVKGRIADLAIERFRSDFGKNLDAATQQKIIERNIDACGDLGDDLRPPGGAHEGK